MSSCKVQFNQLIRECSALKKIKDHESFVKHFKYLTSDWREIVSFLDLKIKKELLILEYYDGPWFREESLEEFLNRHLRPSPVDEWEKKRELS